MGDPLGLGLRACFRYLCAQSARGKRKHPGCKGERQGADFQLKAGKRGRGNAGRSGLYNREALSCMYSWRRNVM